MKRLSFLISGICLLCIFSFAGCSKSSGSTKSRNSSEKEIELTFFNTSAEVNNQFSELFDVYHQSHPNVTITLIPTPIGGQQIQQFQSLLASKNPATLANLDIGTIYLYKNKFMDLTSEKDYFENIAQQGAVDSALLDGRLIGIPYTVQGYGLLYNKRVVDTALGTTFDPSSIRTRNDLESLFEKLSRAGVPPVMVHGANWSVGAHYLTLAYALQSPDVTKDVQFVTDMENGKVDLGKNTLYRGLLDTFDLLKKYNYRKNDPLVADYAKDCLDFASGKVAFFFMGDWVWSQIGNLEGIDREYGIIPVPVSNNPDDYGNSRIPVSEPKLFAIDNSGSTPEQQAAAVDFIKWLLTSAEGQTALVSKMGFNMPYKGVTVKSDNVLSDAVSKYIQSGKTINIGVMTYLPADYYTATGDSMLKYLAGKTDRPSLTNEILSYWKSVAAR